ncbi:hypothetical protein BpHYR1_006733 [Brachionus plicatilis]|uniref:Uncharacterized protein n=1 Tax=Brachionus plicatilis TaxID=10195 RepID=A0A3M7SEB7_BRAPC|nr:hypothetical protein BpHYR1_006733 [Brachionus plicatilis]
MALATETTQLGICCHELLSRRIVLVRQRIPNVFDARNMITKIDDFDFLFVSYHFIDYNVCDKNLDFTCQIEK